MIKHISGGGGVHQRVNEPISVPWHVRASTVIVVSSSKCNLS